MAKWFALLALGLFLPAAAQNSLPDLIVSVPEHHPAAEFIEASLGEAYRRIGYHLVLKPLPLARAIEAANAGETDGEAARTREAAERYPNLREVPEALMTLDMQVVTASARLPLSSWDSLKGHKLCITLGEKLAEQRTAHLERETARGLESTILMLKAGRCEAAIITKSRWIEIDQKGLGPLCPAAVSLEEVSVYHYLNARHADLVPRLAEAMRAMRQDGSTARAMAPFLAQIEEAKTRSSRCSAVTDAARPSQTAPPR